MNTVVPLPAAAADSVLAQHAIEIRRLGRRLIDDLIEIGRRLADAKKRIGHGFYLEWLEREFSWSHDQAARFIRLFELSQTNKFRELRNLRVSASSLFLLARTTPETCDEIIARASRGEKLTAAKIGDAIAASRHASALLAADIAKAVPSFGQPAPPPTSPPLPATAQDGIDRASAGEVARKLARLEELEVEVVRLRRINIALQSQITELEAEVARLRAPAGAIAGAPTLSGAWATATIDEKRAELAKLNIAGLLRLLPDTTKAALSRRAAVDDTGEAT
jgi:DUF3102 family protein